jgi:hypothetical protein
MQNPIIKIATNVGERGSIVVKALCCMPEGHGVRDEMKRMDFSNYLILSAAV